MPTVSEPVAAVRAVVDASIAAVHERLRDENLQPVAELVERERVIAGRATAAHGLEQIGFSLSPVLL